MKKILFVLIIILTLPSIADAQRWKQYRRQVIGGAGVTNFLGDLGGGNDIGRDFVWDLDFAATRPSLLVGYRYQLNTFMFLRANLQWGILRSNDELTEEPFRSQRNLNFRTGFFEADLMAEFYIIQNARGNLYRLRGVRGRRGLKMDVYLFGGLGLMYFNPKAQDNAGTWTALQPLGTEGQGLPGEDDKYKRFTFTIPYGIGIGKSIDRYWGVNLEFSARATFSDYIDDVSGSYYGRQKLYDAKIAQGASDAEARRAAIFSDPNLTFNATDQRDLTIADSGFDNERNESRPHQIVIRGDETDKDAYMTAMITVSRKIVKRRRSRPKF
jgi:hypothetical protein